MVSLQALELFVATVQAGSYSAAARATGLSPASVSRHVAGLEQDLGVQLINRTSRSLLPTEAGTNYFLRVEPILREIREAGEEAGAFQVALQGTLRLHSRVMFGLRVISRLLPEFRRRYPDLRVDLRLEEHDAHLGLEDYDIDFRIGRPLEGDLMQRRVFASERVLVASPAYVASMPPLRNAADIVRHRCLTYWLGQDATVWRFRHGGAADDIAVPSAFSTNSGEVLRSMAVSGEGIALLDDYTVQADRDAGRLVRLLPEVSVSNTGHPSGIFAVFRRAQFTPAKIQVFLNFLSEHADAPRHGS